MNKWQNYPMGPELRRYLGLSSQTDDVSAQEVSDDLARSFQDDLAIHFKKNPPLNKDESIDLLEETIAMGLSAATIALYDAIDQEELESEFRCQLAVGSAYVLENCLEEAEAAFVRAQSLEPRELSPYVNLASLFYSVERDDEALTWCKAGLQVEPNSQRLWEVSASVLLESEASSAADKVREMATAINSYTGLSLAAHLLDPNDRLLKAQILEEPYNQGIRSEEYMVEYTAALGLAGQYEKIPHIIWQLENIDGQKPTWRLLSHVAQAHFALNNEPEALKVVERISQLEDVPENVLTDLRQTYDSNFGSVQ